MSITGGKCHAIGCDYPHMHGSDFCYVCVQYAESYQERMNPILKPIPTSVDDTPPLEVQVGGDHYKKCAIQPVEYIHANGISFIEGSVIKYMTRWRDKGGIKDLEKAKHFIDLLISLEAKNGNF